MNFITINGLLSIGDTVEIFNDIGKGRVGKLTYINPETLVASVYVQDSTGGYTISVPADHLVTISTEQIKKPERYNKRGKLECWDVILDQEMNFLEGNIIKYLWRYKEKNGVEDLKKARVYLDKLISEVEKK